MLQQKIGQTKCLTKIAISLDIGKFWSGPCPMTDSYLQPCARYSMHELT